MYVPLLTGACSRIPSLGNSASAGSSKLDPAALAPGTAALAQPQPGAGTRAAAPAAGPCASIPLPWRHSSALCASSPWAAARSPPNSSLTPVRRAAGLRGIRSLRMRLRGRPERPHGDRPGSVGLPLPHCQVTIAADGEVMVSGSAMLGYLGKRARRAARSPQGSGSDRRGGLPAHHGAQEERADHRLWPQLLPEWGKPRPSSARPSPASSSSVTVSPPTWPLSSRCRAASPNCQSRLPGSTSSCPITPASITGCRSPWISSPAC